jgi:hypothetical protein
VQVLLDKKANLVDYSNDAILSARATGHYGIAFMLLEARANMIMVAENGPDQ